MRFYRTNLGSTFLTAAMVLSTFSVLLNSAEVKDFRYFKNANYDGSVKSADMSSINFDGEMYRNVVNLFTDLMVTDVNLKPLPFEVKKQTQTLLSSHPEECPSKILFESADRRTFELENLNRIYVSDVRLFMSAENYEKTVDVFSSNDRKNWKMVRHYGIVFKFDRFNLKRGAVSFVPDNSRYFKVMVVSPDPVRNCLQEMIFPEKLAVDHAVHDTLVCIDDIKLYHSITLTRTVDTYSDQVDLKRIGYRIIGNDCEMLMTSMCQPLLGFRLTFSHDTRSRSVAIFGSNDNKTWNLLNEGAYVDLVLPDFRLQNNFFSISESRYPYYLFRYSRLGAEDGMELNIRAHSAIYNIIMPGGLPPEIKVFFGGKAAPVKYDLSALRPIKDPLMAEYRLSPQNFNPDYGSQAGMYLLKIFFLIVIVIIAIILAVIIGKFIRSNSHLRNEPM